MHASFYSSFFFSQALDERTVYDQQLICCVEILIEGSKIISFAYGVKIYSKVLVKILYVVGKSDRPL